MVWSGFIAGLDGFRVGTLLAAKFIKGHAFQIWGRFPAASGPLIVTESITRIGGMTMSKFFAHPAPDGIAFYFP